MAYISGCYRWNDVLSAGNFLFQGNLLINGEAYTAAMIQPAEEDDTGTSTAVSIIVNEEGDYYGVYLGQHGWIEALDPLADKPVAVKSALWQTWDFGDAEQEIDGESLAFLLENAAKVVSAEAVGVTYGGRLVASLTAGQTATLRCEGKKMTTNVVVTVPEPAQTESGEGAALNLAFGDTAPEDTGKLWVKTAEPLSVEVKLNADVTGNDGLLSGIAAIQTAAYGIGTAAVGTKVYLFGGRIGTTSTNSNSYNSSIRVFDTETGTVETLSTTLPNKAEGIAAAAVGTKIYLFGGYYYSSGEVYSSAIRVFHTETGTVETLSTVLPKGAYNMGAAAVGTKIYLFGGRIKATSAYSSYLTTIHVFNTETGTIETLSTALPNRAERIGTAAVGTKIYLFGGCSYDDGIVYLSAIRVFHTETGTIETLSTTLPTRTASMGAAAVGTKIYLFGGYGEKYLSEIRVFDTETGTVETLSTTLPTLTEGMGTATVGTKVYLFGGCYLSTYYSSIHQFTALIDLPENHLMIEASAFENRFHLLPNLEIGVKNVYLGDLFGKGKRVAAALYQDGAWVEI